MIDLTPLDGLADALGVDRGELISLVGGGGKTTTLFTLARQMSGTAVLTTTTKMGSEQTGEFPVLIGPSDDELRVRLKTDPRVLAWKNVDDRRAVGVDAPTCDRWFDIADNVVVEADGSRKRPFKAPLQYEPVIPTRTTLLVACIGARALGVPIDVSCHRPERVAELLGCSVTDKLTPQRAAQVLLSSEGSRKDLPTHSRFVVALHRVTPADQRHADELASLLGDKADLVAVAAT